MLPAKYSEWISELREIASVGGIGWIPVQTRLAGAVAIMFSEINERLDDEELMAFIEDRCKAEQEYYLASPTNNSILDR